MADRSGIEWTDATWNPIVGCSVVSPGCTNCYAMRLAGTRLRAHPSRAGLTRDSKAGPVWTGDVRLNEQWLDQPLQWVWPRRVFVCAHGDLFHEHVPEEWIDRVFVTMALAQRHTFQVLTKRPANMRAYLSDGRALGRLGGKIEHARRARGEDGVGPISGRPGSVWWPLPNVWIGTSVEDQARAVERIPELLATPAAIRWISAEPLLGPVDLTKIEDNHDSHGQRLDTDSDMVIDAVNGTMTLTHQGRVIRAPDFPINERLDWVVAGGESGPGARPMHPDWARSLRDQCGAAGVPFLFKQWGEWIATYDRDRDDPDWRQCERQTKKGRWVNLAGGHGFHGERVMRMVPVGKRAAGRLLDGRTWDEYPASEAS